MEEGFVISWGRYDELIVITGGPLSGFMVQDVSLKR
jgi:hypothetical protein